MRGPVLTLVVAVLSTLVWGEAGVASGSPPNLGLDESTTQPGGEAALAERLAEIESFDATFTQTVFGSRGEAVQQSEGRLTIARPNQFRWEVYSPYPQTIVTVGERIYLHDPDLEQVTIRALDEALTGTPALILAGDPAEITQGFLVAHQRTLDDHFVLVPTDENSLYGELRLIFGARTLDRIEILDSFGQVTQVSFFNVTLNEPIDTARFSFEIPAGAEVIDDVGDAAAQ